MSESIICRLCLAEEGNMDYIFSPSSSSINFVQKIYECTSLKLQDSSKLPNRICEICKSELIIWLKFKRQCLNSNTILQSKYVDFITATIAESNDTEKLEKYTQTDNNNVVIFDESNIEQHHLDEFEEQHQHQQHFGTQNIENDDPVDINLQINEHNIKYDDKKDKILNLLSEDGGELTEYSILEYDQNDINEFVDHTYTEVECTSKINVFKINMDKIDINNSNSIIDDDGNNDHDDVNDKKNVDNKTQIYSLLNINGEDETVIVNDEINNDCDNDDVENDTVDNNYNNNESENVEMLLDSDNDDNNIMDDDDIDNYNDDDDENSNKLQQNINMRTNDDSGNMLWQTNNVQIKNETSKRVTIEKGIGISGEVRIVRSIDGKRVSYSYPCTICGQMQTNLKQHMRTHNEELPFKCPYSECVRAFRQASNLKNHINIHTGEKPYPCQLCEKKFSEPSGLRSHMVLHTGERKYHCTDCGKSFGWSHTLKAHQRIHTQDRRHPCSVCCKRFLSAHALKKHVRTHTGEKPYECEICGKSFNTSGNLSSHRKTHLKDHPFNCDYCTEKFQHLNSLKKHVQKIHKQNINMTTNTANNNTMTSVMKNTTTRSINEIVHINDNNDEDDGYKIEILLAEVTSDE